MGFPGSLPTSVASLTALASGAFPSVADGVRDLIKKQVPMFYIFDKFKMTKVGNWGPHYLVRVNDKDDSQPKAFQGLDTLSKGAVQAPRSAMFGFANYDINVTIPWEDEINLTGANALGDYVEEITFKQARALGGLVSDDFIHGNQADSKKALGLEQAVIAKAHDTTGDPWTAARWQFRQMTNTYGGVARSAFTSATAGGSNWESLSCNIGDLTNGADETFLSGTVGATTELLKTFNRFLNCLTYEATTPNLILSSWRPQEDLNNAGFGVQRISQDEKGEGLDLGLSITHYKGIPWYASDKIVHSGVTVTGQTAVTKTEILYALTTSTWSHLVHTEGNWAQIPFLGLTDQAGVIGRLRLRTQLVMEDPLVNGVLGNYGA